MQTKLLRVCPQFKRFLFSSKPAPATSSANIYERKELLVGANKVFLDNPHWSINKYDEAIKLDGSCYITYIKRAFGYYQIELWDQALDDAKTALSLQPLNSEAHFVMGIVYVKKEEFAQALDCLHKSLDLTCPVDPRFESIQSIIKNIQRKIKGETVLDILNTSQPPPRAQPTPPQATPVQPAPAATPPVQQDEGLPPFQDPNFQQTQQQISQKMYDMGDDKFKKRMEELATIPELQEFQRILLSGKTPTQEDYIKLYNEPTGRFRKFAERLSQMQQHPDLQEFAQLASTGDWNIAFSSLNNNPRAMEAYMEYFQEDDDDVDTVEAKTN